MSFDDELAEELNQGAVAGSESSFADELEAELNQSGSGGFWGSKPVKEPDEITEARKVAGISSLEEDIAQRGYLGMAWGRTLGNTSGRAREQLEEYERLWSPENFEASRAVWREEREKEIFDGLMSKAKRALIATVTGMDAKQMDQLYGQFNAIGKIPSDVKHEVYGLAAGGLEAIRDVFDRVDQGGNYIKEWAAGVEGGFEGEEVGLWDAVFRSPEDSKYTADLSLRRIEAAQEKAVAKRREEWLSSPLADVLRKSGVSDEEIAHSADVWARRGVDLDLRKSVMESLFGQGADETTEQLSHGAKVFFYSLLSPWLAVGGMGTLNRLGTGLKLEQEAVKQAALRLRKGLPGGIDAGKIVSGAEYVPQTAIKLGATWAEQARQGYRPLVTVFGIPAVPFSSDVSYAVFRTLGPLGAGIKQLGHVPGVKEGLRWLADTSHAMFGSELGLPEDIRSIYQMQRWDNRWKAMKAQQVADRMRSRRNLFDDNARKALERGINPIPLDDVAKTAALGPGPQTAEEYLPWVRRLFEVGGEEGINAARVMGYIDETEHGVLMAMKAESDDLYRQVLGTEVEFDVLKSESVNQYFAHQTTREGHVLLESIFSEIGSPQDRMNFVLAGMSKTPGWTMKRLDDLPVDEVNRMFRERIKSMLAEDPTKLNKHTAAIDKVDLLETDLFVGAANRELAQLSVVRDRQTLHRIAELFGTNTNIPAKNFTQIAKHGKRFGPGIPKAVAGELSRNMRDIAAVQDDLWKHIEENPMAFVEGVASRDSARELVRLARSAGDSKALAEEAALRARAQLAKLPSGLGLDPNELMAARGMSDWDQFQVRMRQKLDEQITARQTLATTEGIQHRAVKALDKTIMQLRMSIKAIEPERMAAGKAYREANAKMGVIGTLGQVIDPELVSNREKMLAAMDNISKFHSATNLTSIYEHMPKEWDRHFTRLTNMMGDLEVKAGQAMTKASEAGRMQRELTAAAAAARGFELGEVERRALMGDKQARKVFREAKNAAREIINRDPTKAAAAPTTFDELFSQAANRLESATETLARIRDLPDMTTIIKEGPLKGWAFQDDVAAWVTKYGNATSPGKFERAFQKIWDPLTRWWVQGTLSPWLPFHSRNFGSDAWAIHVDGTAGLMDYKLGWEANALYAARGQTRRNAALQQMDALATGEKPRDLAMDALHNTQVELQPLVKGGKGEVKSLGDFMNEMEDVGLLLPQGLQGAMPGKDTVSRMITEDTTSGLDGLRETLRNFKRKPVASKNSKLPPVIQKSIEILGRVPIPYFPGSTHNNLLYKLGNITGDTISNWTRSTLYIAKRRAGFTSETAALEVKRILYSHTELGDGEKWLRRAMPFWSWTRNNVPAQIRNIIEKPHKVQQGFSAIAGAEAALHKDEKRLPRTAYEAWKRRAGLIRAGLDDDGNAQAYTMAGYWAVGDAVLSGGVGIHPVITAILEAATGLDIGRSDLGRGVFEPRRKGVVNYLGGQTKAGTADLIDLLRLPATLQKLNPGSMLGDVGKPAKVNLIPWAMTATSRDFAQPSANMRLSQFLLGIRAYAHNPKYTFKKLEKAAAEQRKEYELEAKYAKSEERRQWARDALVEIDGLDKRLREDKKSWMIMTGRYAEPEDE